MNRWSLGISATLDAGDVALVQRGSFRSGNSTQQTESPSHAGNSRECEWPGGLGLREVRVGFAPRPGIGSFRHSKGRSRGSEDPDTTR